MFWPRRRSAQVGGGGGNRNDLVSSRLPGNDSSGPRSGVNFARTMALSAPFSPPANALRSVASSSAFKGLSPTSPNIFTTKASAKARRVRKTASSIVSSDDSTVDTIPISESPLFVTSLGKSIQFYIADDGSFGKSSLICTLRSKVIANGGNIVHDPLLADIVVATTSTAFQKIVGQSVALRGSEHKLVIPKYIYDSIHQREVLDPARYNPLQDGGANSKSSPITPSRKSLFLHRLKNLGGIEQKSEPAVAMSSENPSRNLANLRSNSSIYAASIKGASNINPPHAFRRSLNGANGVNDSNGAQSKLVRRGRLSETSSQLHNTTAPAASNGQVGPVSRLGLRNRRRTFSSELVGTSFGDDDNSNSHDAEIQLEADDQLTESLLSSQSHNLEITRPTQANDYTEEDWSDGDIQIDRSISSTAMELHAMVDADQPPQSLKGSAKAPSSVTIPNRLVAAVLQQGDSPLPTPPPLLRESDLLDGKGAASGLLEGGKVTAGSPELHSDNPETPTDMTTDHPPIGAALSEPRPSGGSARPASPSDSRNGSADESDIPPIQMPSTPIRAGQTRQPEQKSLPSSSPPMLPTVHTGKRKRRLSTNNSEYTHGTTSPTPGTMNSAELLGQDNSDFADRQVARRTRSRRTTHKPRRQLTNERGSPVGVGSKRMRLLGEAPNSSREESESSEGSRGRTSPNINGGAGRKRRGGGDSGSDASGAARGSAKKDRGAARRNKSAPLVRSTQEPDISGVDPASRVSTHNSSLHNTEGKAMPVRKSPRLSGVLNARATSKSSAAEQLEEGVTQEDDSNVNTGGEEIVYPSPSGSIGVGVNMDEVINEGRENKGDTTVASRHRPVFTRPTAPLSPKTPILASEARDGDSPAQGRNMSDQGPAPGLRRSPRIIAQKPSRPAKVPSYTYKTESSKKRASSRRQSKGRARSSSFTSSSLPLSHDNEAEDSNAIAIQESHPSANSSAEEAATESTPPKVAVKPPNGDNRDISFDYEGGTVDGTDQILDSSSKHITGDSESDWVTGDQAAAETKREDKPAEEPPNEAPLLSTESVLFIPEEGSAASSRSTTPDQLRESLKSPSLDASPSSSQVEVAIPIMNISPSVRLIEDTINQHDHGDADSLDDQSTAPASTLDSTKNATVGQ
ncbi:hypothetical protein EV182_001460, partial [Spiromyces aspiralis]